MKIKISLLLTFTVFVATIAFSQGKVYKPEKKTGRKISAERSSLKFYDVDLETDKQSAAAIAAIIPVAVKSGLSITKYVLSKREEKFSADYSAKISSDDFYEKNQQLNLQGLEFKREFKFKNSNDFEKGIYFKLLPDISRDGRSFRFGLEELELNYSKAKTSKKVDFIDISIEIKIKAFVESEEKYEEKEIGNKVVKIEGVEFGSDNKIDIDAKNNIENWSGWFPIPNIELVVEPGELVELENKLDLNKQALAKGLTLEELLKEGWYKSELSHFIRFLKIGGTYYEQKGRKQAGGNYEIELTVKEVNPRKMNTQKAKEFFEENSEAINDVVSVVVENSLDTNEESENDEGDDSSEEENQIEEP